MSVQALKKIKITEALNTNIWDVDSRPHIKVDYEKCRKLCDKKICTLLCPAGCYTLSDDGILFSYEGCLECGTCRIVCPHEAVKWDYPLSGRGVQYRFG
ncbi:MAG: 4Fe-4S dicluster domain-containing protein [Nitrososphaerota archaeon]